ncbi:MAG TPA: hypothetical protein VK738_05370 [Terriglobales bacterium]|nr:hypothetical protein [Terriglobales bacterium]
MDHTTRQVRNNREFSKRVYYFVLVLATVGLMLPYARNAWAGPAQKSKPNRTAKSKASQTGGTCPLQGWSEGLSNYLKLGAKFPTQDTPLSAKDCNFQQWSWEAFTWAMAPVGPSGAPRFLTLPSEDDLTSTSADAKTLHLRTLKLAARTLRKAGAAGGAQGPGAIVEADGNMMVGPGGYPVYASVHMNPSYFASAKANLITSSGGQYQYPSAPYFSVGAAVFKATWIRVVGNPPAGAYTTQAQVPNLTQVPPNSGTIMPNGTYSTVTVALVGLHVVGYTINHKEFVWGTFEHNLNTPATPDFMFQPSPSITCSTGFTFCPAGTLYSKVNICAVPGNAGSGCTGGLSLNSQAVSPITYSVQENATGGDTLPNGPADIQNVNAQAQGALPSPFPNYHLVGTVWMQPNTYNSNSTVTNSVGSVNLANTTAETFQQLAANPGTKPTNNCFSCHYPGANNYPACGYNKLPKNVIAVSHVITLGTPWAVENQIPASSSCVQGLVHRPGAKK